MIRRELAGKIETTAQPMCGTCTHSEARIEHREPYLYCTLFNHRASRPCSDWQREPGIEG
jgi:hypothetical protein